MTKKYTVQELKLAIEKTWLDVRYYNGEEPWNYVYFISRHFRVLGPFCNKTYDEFRVNGNGKLELKESLGYSDIMPDGIRERFQGNLLTKGDKEMTDKTNHPLNYESFGAQCSGCEKDIECADITNAMGYNLGTALEYIWRADTFGQKKQDLQDAIWHLQDEIKRAEVK